MREENDNSTTWTHAPPPPTGARINYGQLKGLPQEDDDVTARPIARFIHLYIDSFTLLASWMTLASVGSFPWAQDPAGSAPDPRRWPPIISRSRRQTDTIFKQNKTKKN